MNKNQHLISRYLGGELDATEAARFEEDLRRDPELRSDLELYREVDEALADTEIIDFRMQLDEMHTRFAPELYAPDRRRLKVFSQIAATVAVLVVAGFASISLLNRGSSGSVADRFYKPYELTSVNRSSSDGAERTLQQALEKYQNRDYRAAVELFQIVLTKDPEQMGTMLYNGISYYELAEYTKAGNSFNAVIEQNDNLYIDQAKWYLGFCYLKTEDKEKAIKQFKEIAESKSSYSQKAKAILKKLR